MSMSLSSSHPYPNPECVIKPKPCQLNIMFVWQLVSLFESHPVQVARFWMVDDRLARACTDDLGVTNFIGAGTEDA